MESEGQASLQVLRVFFQGSWPLRWKGLEHYNHGPAFDIMFNLLRPLVKKKMRERVRVALQCCQIMTAGQNT